MADRISIDVLFREGDAVSGMNRLNTSLGSVESKARAAGSGASAGMTQMTVSIEKANNAVMGLQIAFVALQSGAGIGVLKLAADMERTQVAMSTMLGSMQDGLEVIDQVKAIALKRPFTFTELRDTTSSLIAFGFSGKEAVRIMDTVSNAAGSLGTSAENASEKLRTITLALGEMKAKGRVNAMQVSRMLGQAGVPATKIIADFIGIKQDDAFKLMEKNRLDADATIEVILRGLEAMRQFQAGAAITEKSLAGMWTNFVDRATYAGIALGNAFLPQAKEAVKWMSNMADSAKHAAEAFRDWPEWIRTTLAGLALFSVALTILPPILRLLGPLAVGWRAMGTAMMGLGAVRSVLIEVMLAAQGVPVAMSAAAVAMKATLISLGEVALVAGVAYAYYKTLDDALSQKELDKPVRTFINKTASGIASLLGFEPDHYMTPDQAEELHQINGVLDRRNAKNTEAILKSINTKRAKADLKPLEIPAELKGDDQWAARLRWLRDRDKEAVESHQDLLKRLIKDNETEIASAEDHARSKLMQVSRETFKGIQAISFAFEEQFRDFGGKSLFSNFALRLAESIEVVRERLKTLDEIRKEMADRQKVADQKRYRQGEEDIRDWTQHQEYRRATRDINEATTASAMENEITRMERRRDQELRRAEMDTNAQSLNGKLDLERKKADIELHYIREIAAQKLAINERERQVAVNNAREEVRNAITLNAAETNNRVRNNADARKAELRNDLAYREVGPMPRIDSVDIKRLQEYEHQLALLAEEVGKAGLDASKPDSKTEVPGDRIMKLNQWLPVQRQYDELNKKFSDVVGDSADNQRQYDSVLKWLKDLTAAKQRLLTPAEDEALNEQVLAENAKNDIARVKDKNERELAINHEYALKQIQIEEDRDAQLLKVREDTYIKSIELIRDATTKMYEGIKSDMGSLFDALVSKAHNWRDMMYGIFKSAVLTPVKGFVTGQAAKYLTEAMTGERVTMDNGKPVIGGPNGNERTGQGIGWIRKIMGLDKADAQAAEEKKKLQELRVTLDATAFNRAVDRDVIATQQNAAAASAQMQATNGNTVALMDTVGALARLTGTLDRLSGGGSPTVRNASWDGGGSQVISDSDLQVQRWLGSPEMQAQRRVSSINYTGSGGIFSGQDPNNPFIMHVAADSGDPGEGGSYSADGSPTPSTVTQVVNQVQSGTAAASQVVGQLPKMPGRNILGELNSIAGIPGMFKAGGLLGKGGGLSKLGDFGQSFESEHGIDGMAGGALLAGGGIAIMDGLRRGGWGGAVEDAAGGAAIGAKFGGVEGAAIGAVAGFAMGLIRLAFPGRRKEIRDKIKQTYQVDISNNGVLDSIDKVIQSQFGGSISLGVPSAQVRQMVMQYAEMTGQRLPLGAEMHPVNLVQSGGQLQQAGTSINGSVYGYSSSLAMSSVNGKFGGYYPSNQPNMPIPYTNAGAMSSLMKTGTGSGATSIALSLDKESTEKVLSGQTVQTLQRNPELASDAVLSAASRSYGRNAARGTYNEPLTSFQ